MNIIELRKSLRRSSVTQRIADRRKVSYEFDSPEWWEYIRKNHIDCPMSNRREADRRSDKRQLSDRRQQLAQTGHSENSYGRIFLTPAERKLLEDLYLSDLD
ncbi:MAG: hypothetical protein PHG00_01910 [Methylococcales bacterium]|nr:hypothetical protein [Methylococcales bacterium]